MSKYTFIITNLDNKEQIEIEDNFLKEIKKITILITNIYGKFTARPAADRSIVITDKYDRTILRMEIVPFPPKEELEELLVALF